MPTFAVILLIVHTLVETIRVNFQFTLSLLRWIFDGVNDEKKTNIPGILSRVCSCRAHQLNAWQITCVCFMSRLIEKKYTKMMRTTFSRIYTRYILGRWHHSHHCYCYWACFIHYNFVWIIIICVKFTWCVHWLYLRLKFNIITMLLIKLRFYREKIII